MNLKNTLNYPKSAAMGFLQGTQELVRNSRGTQAISVNCILLKICSDKNLHKRNKDSDTSSLELSQQNGSNEVS